MMKPYTAARVLLLALLAVLASCSGGDAVRSKLDHVENTIVDEPEAAYRTLDSLGNSKIDDTGDAACYALLMTQAQNMMGMDVTDDSLINTAVSYYRKDGDEKRLKKALYYKGLVHFHAKEYGEAMLSATEATTLAKSENDYLGMAKGEELLASIFRHTQKSDDCLKHSRLAAEYYKKAGREINYQFCLTDIVDAYTMNSKGYDKALVLLDSIESVATDSGVLSDCMGQRMYIYVDSKQYQKADECMKKLKGLRHDYRSGPVEYTWQAQVAHGLGHKEQAWLYIDSARAEVRDALDKLYITRAVYRMFKDEQRYHDAVLCADSILAYQDEALGEGFRQSVVSAQRDFYRTQARRENVEKGRMKMLSILVSFVCLIILGVVGGLHQFRLHVKDSEIESKMNEILVLSERVRKDDKENKDLKVLAERSMRDRWDTVNMLCNEYFEKGDNQKLRSTIMNKVDKEMERICSKKHMEEIEALVNSSMNGIVDKLREQCPELKSEDVLFATLVYSGLAPRAVCLCTGIKLKYFYTKRMRIVERINNSSAHDKEWFISKLWHQTGKEPGAQEAEQTKNEA